MVTLLTPPALWRDLLQWQKCEAWMLLRAMRLLSVCFCIFFIVCTESSFSCSHTVVCHAKRHPRKDPNIPASNLQLWGLNTQIGCVMLWLSLAVNYSSAETPRLCESQQKQLSYLVWLIALLLAVSWDTFKESFKYSRASLIETSGLGKTQHPLHSAERKNRAGVIFHFLLSRGLQTFFFFCCPCLPLFFFLLHHSLSITEGRLSSFVSYAVTLGSAETKHGVSNQVSEGELIWGQKTRWGECFVICSSHIFTEMVDVDTVISPAEFASLVIMFCFVSLGEKWLYLDGCVEPEYGKYASCTSLLIFFSEMIAM